MKRFAPLIGALVGGVAGFAIGYYLASADINKEGDWRNGAARFVGMASAIGIMLGYVVTSRFTRGVAVTRDGFTLSYRPADPVPTGYRELRTLTINDLIERLRAVGYAPVVQECDEVGERSARTSDPTTTLVGANVAVTDPGVKGWIRVQLPAPRVDQARALGLVEVWTERGDSAEELALFTMRCLGELVGGLAASRESSRLSEDPVAMLTAGLAERPRHRRG
jgi:hypothetical protein